MAMVNRLVRVGTAIPALRTGSHSVIPRIGIRLNSSTTTTTTDASSAATPAPATIADTSFWKSLVPKPLRRENRDQTKPKKKDWNPATFFIVMFLLVGSMSIQMIALRNQFDRYARQSSVRIGRLREVVERIQNGEKVDVEKALGTGDAQQEEDWEEMLQAIERDESTQSSQKKPRKKQAEPQQQQTETPSSETTTRASETTDSTPKKKSAAHFGNFF